MTPPCWRGRRPPPNSLTDLSRAHSMGTIESRASSIHPSTPTFLSAAAAAPPLRLLQCRPHSIHECGGRLGEGCDCAASTLEGRRDRPVVLVVVAPVMGAHHERLATTASGGGDLLTTEPSGNFVAPASTLCSTSFTEHISSTKTPPCGKYETNISKIFLKGYCLSERCATYVVFRLVFLRGPK